MNKAKVKDKIYMGCRCYERLQPNTKEFTLLVYTELVLELEHLKIETRCYERLQPNTKEFTRLAYTELVLELEHRQIETR
jgi:hypothetical protein